MRKALLMVSIFIWHLPLACSMNHLAQEGLNRTRVIEWCSSTDTKATKEWFLEQNKDKKFSGEIYHYFVHAQNADGTGRCATILDTMVTHTLEKEFLRSFIEIECPYAHANIDFAVKKLPKTIHLPSELLVDGKKEIEPLKFAIDVMLHINENRTNISKALIEIIPAEMRAPFLESLRPFLGKRIDEIKSTYQNNPSLLTSINTKITNQLNKIILCCGALALLYCMFFYKKTA